MYHYLLMTGYNKALYTATWNQVLRLHVYSKCQAQHALLGAKCCGVPILTICSNHFPLTQSLCEEEEVRGPVEDT